MLGKEKLDAFTGTAFGLMEEETPDDATLGACLMICEVRVRQPGGEELTAFYMHSTDKRGWVQRALIEEAQAAGAMVGG
jgi:hypothetical protein